MTNPKQTLQQRIAASEDLPRTQQEGMDLILLWDNLQRPPSTSVVTKSPWIP